MSTTASAAIGRPTSTTERDLPQYSALRILAVWAAVTAPMSVLGWLVAPWLAHHLGGRDPFIDALFLCFNLGLLWQVVLALGVVRREQGSLGWAGLRRGLWLWSPRDPRSGRVGGRVWWWVVPFIVLSGLVNLLPIDPVGPLPRDLPHAILTDRVARYFDGNWTGFALAAVCAFLAPVAEELLFRGVLLPRMRGVFGRADAVANGVLFTLYHLHQPWSMPATLIDGIVNQAYASRRFQSIWMGLVTHTAPSFLTVTALVFLVL